MNHNEIKEPLFASGRLISIPQVRYSITGKFTAPRGTKQLGPGKSYVPPCTLNMTNSTPKRMLNRQMLSAASQALPKNFSWNNSSDAKSKGLPGNIILSPGNQLQCGSCWAWAVSTSLSDRMAIKHGSNPGLGPSYLLACSVTGNCDKDNLSGCNGGRIDKALDALVKPIGGVKTKCWNYSWCDHCSGDGDTDNALIPSFPANQNKCVSEQGATPGLFKVKDGTVQTLPGMVEDKVDYTAIKESIFNNGPIPTGYIVFQDFFMGTADKSQGGDNWAPTKGVYVHLDTDNTGITPDGDSSPYKYGSSSDMNTQAGAHAVVIVGWGETEIPNIVPKAWAKKNPGSPVPAKITIPYWIVRNSWGTNWCEKGFFRIAQTNPDLHIGTTVSFDQAAAGSVGGVIDFHPDLTNVPKLQRFKLLKSGDSTSPNRTWIIIGIVGVLIVISLVVLRKMKQ